MSSQSPQVSRRVVSGIRSTGQLHIGHYFGALKNWLRLQDNYNCFFGIMDWHALTTTYKKSEEVEIWNRNIFAELVAWGLDLDKVHVFVQSQVPEHLELFMILANITPMGWLERVPTWKDAEAEAKASDTHNLGRFSYPVLQTADVMIYKGQLVPVGADQVAHLELSREIVRRFNHLYKTKFPEAEALLTETPMVPGSDGRKMSKSYDNGILLAEEDKDLAKKIRGTPTDPQRVRREDAGEPTKCSVYAFHKLFSSAEDLQWVETGCRSAGIGCGDCKGKLVHTMSLTLAPARERKKALLGDQAKLDRMISEQSARAREEAKKGLSQVKSAMGLKL
jgi:tryptophanyl-tRNA synthetase